MKRKIIGFLVCALLITTILPVTVSSDYPSNNIIYVDDDNIDGPWDGSQEHPYRFIADGVEAADNGDTVYVYSGTYYENLLIEKSICLEGENRETTTIHGSSWERVVNISCDDVTVKGFSIIHGSGGIRVYKSNNITITENIIKLNKGGGIYLYHTNGNTITHNVVSENGIFEPYVISDSTGILIMHSNNNNISGNIVSGNSNWGFLIFYLNDSIISSNSVSSNRGLGFDFYVSFDNYITENNFIENGEIVGTDWGDLTDNVRFTYLMFSKGPYNNIWDKNLG